MSKYLVDHEDNPDDLLALLTPPERTLTAAEHGALPISIPDLTPLTNDELLSLRRYIQGQVREARKKSNQLLNRDEKLRRAWVDTIGGSQMAHDAKPVFLRLILKFPAAFLAYTYVNSLFVIDEAILIEINKRSKAT